MFCLPYRRQEKQNAEFRTTEYSNHLNCSNQFLLKALCWAPNWLRGYCGRWACLGPLSGVPRSLVALFHCMVRHGTVRYGLLLGGFPLGTVPGTWYFFSTTSVEVPSEPYRYQNVTCKLYWSLIGRRESSLLRHWTCDTRPSSTALPARFKSAQPAKDRTQLLFKQTHIFASTTK